MVDIFYMIATRRSRPVLVPGLTKVTSVGGGELHSLGLLTDMSLTAWGNNGDGQLGIGETWSPQTVVWEP